MNTKVLGFLDKCELDAVRSDMRKVWGVDGAEFEELWDPVMAEARSGKIRQFPVSLKLTNDALLRYRREDGC